MRITLLIRRNKFFTCHFLLVKFQLCGHGHSAIEELFVILDAFIDYVTVLSFFLKEIIIFPAVKYG